VPSPTTGRSHLGLNIYYWGRGSQDRLLVDCLYPLTLDLRRDGRLERFWYDRFDARGPHLICLFTPGSGTTIGELESAIDPRLLSHIARDPSLETVDPDELATRHEQCRGKQLCSADELPGLADNNTVTWFEQTDRDYPFALARHLEHAEDYWRLFDLQTRWVLDRLSAQRGRPSTGTAIKWLAALDVELRKAQRDAEGYWRYHASTLLLDRRESETESAETLLEWVGESNTRIFGDVWDKVEALPSTWAHVRELARVAVEPEADSPRLRWAALRELTHVTLKQLGLPVRLHVPLVLFAWSRHLEIAPTPASAPRSH
jgi:hypothetical protein